MGGEVIKSCGLGCGAVYGLKNFSLGDRAKVKNAVEVSAQRKLNYGVVKWFCDWWMAIYYCCVMG